MTYSRISEARVGASMNQKCRVTWRENGVAKLKVFKRVGQAIKYMSTRPVGVLCSLTREGTVMYLRVTADGLKISGVPDVE